MHFIALDVFICSGWYNRIIDREHWNRVGSRRRQPPSRKDDIASRPALNPPVRDHVGCLGLNRIEIMRLDIVHDRNGTRPILQGLTGFDIRRNYHAFMHTAPSSSLLLSQALFYLGIKVVSCSLLTLNAIDWLMMKFNRTFFIFSIKVML